MTIEADEEYWQRHYHIESRLNRAVFTGWAFVAAHFLFGGFPPWWIVAIPFGVALGIIIGASEAS